MSNDTPVPYNCMMSFNLDNILVDISEELTYRDCVLSVSHSNYLSALGGTEKVLMEEQQAFFSRRISYIQIYPLEQQARRGVPAAPHQLVGINVDATPLGSMTLLQLCVVLQSMVIRHEIRLAAVHLHHLMDMSLLGVGFLIDTLMPAAVRFFVHDYFTICSSFNLLTDENTYCGIGSPAPRGCDGCTRCDNHAAHLVRMRSFLNRLNPEVVAPSETASAIWANYFPDLKERIRIIPHQVVEPVTGQRDIREDRFKNPAIPLKIAYLGYESLNKGLETWWRLSENDCIRNAFDLYHLGAAGKKIPGVTYVPVSFQDDGPDAMVDALTTHAIDVAFLWSIWPETYSFTFFEALAAGCFVITNRLSGNIHVQVQQRGCGMAFETELEMIRFLSDPQRVRRAIEVDGRCRGKRFRLLYNPLIAEETAEQVQIRNETERSANDDSDDYRMRSLRNWFSLLGQLSDTQQKDDDTPQLFYQANQLRARLAVYQRSRLHRMVESLRNWFVDHPELGNRLRPVLVRASNVFFQFFHRKEV